MPPSGACLGHERNDASVLDMSELHPEHRVVTLPTGPAVTFFFSDIEGSTRLAHDLDADAWEALLAEHDRLVDETVVAAGGGVVQHEGGGGVGAVGGAAGGGLAAGALRRGPGPVP